MVEVERRERRGDVVEREAQLVHDARWAERDPRIRRSLIAAAVRGRPTRADGDLRNHDLLPARASIHADAGDQAPRAAVRPAVLLPDTHQIGRIRPVDADPRLDLAVQVNPAALRRNIVGCAARKRTRARDLDEWTSRKGRRRNACCDREHADNGRTKGTHTLFPHRPPLILDAAVSQAHGPRSTGAGQDARPWPDPKGAVAARRSLP